VSRPTEPADSLDALKIITVRHDDSDGLEVDWDGMNAYEAWSYLHWAIGLVEDVICGDDEDD
jgi:hypothetical protein